MSRFLASLRGRIILATLGVAALVVTTTGLVALPLVKSVAEDQAREQIAREATALAESPDLAGRLRIRERRIVGGDSDQFAVVMTDGRSKGSAAAYLDASQRARLLRGDELSDSVRRDGQSVLLEGRPFKSGGAIVVARPLDAVDDSIRALLTRIGLALLAGLLMAAAVGVLTVRRLSRPIMQTATVARRLASGERGIPVERPGITEVDDLAAALDSLDEALTTSEARQREFLLSVSHEIRTPLTAIQGYAEALADGVVPAGRVVHTGATIRDESQRLERFVSDLLLLARLEADDFSVENISADVAELVDQSLNAWDAQAHLLGVELTGRLDRRDLFATIDPMRVRQLVDGLLENALRVTPPGGRVMLVVAATSRHLTIAVEDSGPGLNDADVKVAFQRGALHYRYRDRRPVGSGLGLSIAARLCERLGGTITIARSRWGGAAFILDLPR